MCVYCVRVRESQREVSRKQTNSSLQS
uniref:Uncharacterized protein n=1 Tax=Arundo donax TaxID=35708 RepID=A0A0A8XUF9_ARUDO